MIFSAACSFSLSIYIVSSTFFSVIHPVEATRIGSDDNYDNSMGFMIEDPTDIIDGSKTIELPDLGDDQTFPFIPGFGKNSGKD